MGCQVFIKKGLFIYTFMTSPRKWVGDLEIFQKFVNSITECLRDFEDSNVLSKIYLLFIFWKRRGAREKLVIFCEHNKCMTPNEVNGNKSVL